MFKPINKESQPKFESGLLLLPSFSSGSVGSLTIDLVSHNNDFQKIGFLDIKYLFPLIETAGNDKMGPVVFAAEVYQNKDVFLLQLRSQIASGRTKDFVKELGKFITENKFSSVIILSSIGITDRPELFGSNAVFKTYYYVNSPAKDKSPIDYKEFAPIEALNEPGSKVDDTLDEAGLTKDILDEKSLEKTAITVLAQVSIPGVDLLAATLQTKSLARTLNSATIKQLTVDKKNLASPTNYELPEYWKALLREFFNPMEYMKGIEQIA